MLLNGASDGADDKETEEAEADCGNRAEEEDAAHESGCETWAGKNDGMNSGACKGSWSAAADHFVTMPWAGS